MKLTVLGSGVMEPKNKRYPSSYLLESGNTRVLLDCGFLNLARLLECKIDIHSINAIAITHFHTDHFGGFLPFIHAKFTALYSCKDRKPLIVLGPETISDRYEKLREVSWPEPDEHYILEFHEGNNQFTIGEQIFRSFTVKHVPWFSSVGYRITENGKTLVYTGDVSPKQDPEFVKNLEGADVLLIEAASPHRGSESHVNIEEAYEFAQKANVKKVLITHLRQNFISPIEDFVKKHSDYIQICEDGNTFEI